jgi:small-conductance mechanosensitive channel
MNVPGIPDSLSSLRDWAGLVQPLLRIVVIVSLAWLFYRGMIKLIALLRRHLDRGPAELEHSKRVDTLADALRHVGILVIGAIAALLVLSEMGVSITPILAAAGVTGIAIGLGAQSLVKDYLAGAILLIENQVRQGDLIEAAGKAGTVEDVTLRHVRLRDYDGTVHFVPNGVITTLSNMSREFSYAVIDVGVDAKDDLQQMLRLIREVGGEVKRDPQIGAVVLEEPEVATLDKWTEGAINVRLRVKTRPGEQRNVRREFMLRLKAAQDASAAQATGRAAEAKSADAAASRTESAHPSRIGARWTT